MIKNHKSIISKWLIKRDINFEKIVFTTAAPLFNRDRDIYGYLKILWPPEFNFVDIKLKVDETNVYDWYSKDFNIENFSSSSQRTHNFVNKSQYSNDKSYKRLIDKIKSGIPLHIYHPGVFFEAYKRHHRRPDFIQKILSPILAGLQTRRLFTTPIFDGENDVVVSLPKCHISTIMVDFDNPTDREYYDNKYKLLLKNRFIWSKKPEDEEEEDDTFQNLKMDENVDRQLRTITTHQAMYNQIDSSMQATRLKRIMPELVKTMTSLSDCSHYPSYKPSILTLLKKEAKKGRKRRPHNSDATGLIGDDLNLIRHCDPTGGLCMFYLATCPDTQIAYPSTDRVDILLYCLAGSPKLLMLFIRLWEICRCSQWEEDSATSEVRSVPKWIRHNRCICFFSTPATQQ
jgi:hypothetical protein